MRAYTDAEIRRKLIRRKKAKKAVIDFISGGAVACLLWAFVLFL